MANKFAIDIGSKYITIYSKGIGVVLKEPTIAIIENTRKRFDVIETGNNALKMLSTLTKKHSVVRPIVNGGIVNEDVFILLMKDFLNRIVSSFFVKQRIDAVVSISCGLNTAERKSIEKALYKAGIAQITLIEAPVSVFQLGNVDNALCIIIGGDITEVAIVCDEGIINGCSIDIAGDKLNKAISNYIANKYKLLVGSFGQEKIKTSIGSMYLNDMSSIEINGKDLVHNVPKVLEITAQDVRHAITPLLDKIVEVIDTVMCSCPDNIIEEVYNNGIFFAGGTSGMAGLGEYLAQRCNMQAKVHPECADAVANGCGSFLTDVESLNRALAIR